MTIDEIQNQIIGEFEIFDDWMDHCSLLIDLGKDLAPLPETEKTPQNLIEGCQSRVWLSARYENGRILFQAESDALLVKGIVALLIRIFSGQSPDEHHQCRLALCRSHWPQQPFITHTFQRITGHDTANEILRDGSF